MKRLFTFGCSYTFYTGGPTWSNFLGLEYDYYENWGIPGLGCRGVSERIAECHARNNFNSSDTVIVQWPSHLRHDYFKFINDNTYHWKTAGSIFHKNNSKIFNDHWVKSFFDEAAYIMHGLNSMVLSIAVLKSTNCNWLMTSTGDFTKLGNDLFSMQIDETNSKIQSIQEQFPLFSFYIDHIWKDHAAFWLTPIAVHANETPDEFWKFKDDQGNYTILERHPSSQQHVSWLNSQLRPALGLANPPAEQQQWLTAIEKLKKDTNDDIQLFYKEILNPNYKHDYWPHDQWFRSAAGF